MLHYCDSSCSGLSLHWREAKEKARKAERTSDRLGYQLLRQVGASLAIVHSPSFEINSRTQSDVGRVPQRRNWEKQGEGRVVEVEDGRGRLYVMDQVDITKALTSRTLPVCFAFSAFTTNCHDQEEHGESSRVHLSISV